MKITKKIIVLDAADLGAVSRCWATLLAGEVKEDDDWHMVHVDGESYLGVQHAPNHQSPNWPEGHQQVHLDLWIDDLADARATAPEAGATLLQPASRDAASEGFEVWADPAGHPFCLCCG